MPFSATRDLWLVLKARDEATRALRGFSRDIRMVGDSVRMANLQASKGALINQMATQRLSGATAAQMLVTQQAIQQNDRQIASMRIAKAAAEEHRVAMQRLSSSMTGAASAAGAVGLALAAAGFFGLRAMKGLIDSSIAYSKQSALTRTQVEGFVNTQKEIEDVGLRVARTIPAAFEQIQPALFDIFSSMDVGIKDAERLLTQFSKASVAGQTDITKAGRSTIGILNAFKLPISDVNHLLDLQFQLVQEGLGTYEEWAGRIGLVTPSAVRFGQSVEMMTAALAASTRMGVPAARAATSVSRAMDAMSHPTAVTNLKNLGIAALDAKGNFRPMIDIMEEFRTKLMKMPGGERIETLLDVFKGAGGTIEARRFLTNMLTKPGNLELFKTIFKEMSEESGSFEQAYSMMAETTAGKTQLLSNQWNALKVMAGAALAPAFLQVVGLFSKLVEWFNNLSPATKKFITTTLGIVLALTAIFGVLALVVGGIAAFVAAFAIAGTSLLVVLGVFAALGVAVAAFVAAIIIAWNKSNGFREAIRSIGQALASLWRDYIVPTGLAIRDAWEQHMQPALSKLAEIIDSKVMPVVRNLQSFVTGEFVNAFKEVGNNIKNFLVKAFEILGSTIETIVIPAIEFLTQFYKDHETAIKMIVSWLIEAAKWFLKLVAVFVVILATPIVGFIIGIIAAIIGLVVAIVTVIDWLRTFVNWLKVEIPKAWGVLVAIFNSGMAFLKNAWSKFWNSDIMQLVRSVFGLIAAIVKLGISVIIKVVQIGLHLLSSAWRTVWNAISSFLKPIINGISNFLSGKWNEIRNTAVTIWNRVRAAIKDPLDRARGDVTSVFDRIRNFFSNAGNWLYDAGKNLILGLIRGVNDRIGQLTSKINEVAQKVRDFWPFSPAKVGPLSGRGSPFHAGQNIAKMLADGMKSGARNLRGVTANMAAGVAQPDLTGLGGRGGRSVTQNFTINTNEINPRRHSAEMGWLIAGRT